MTTPLPLFYFKPTVCWIDDDQIFLDAVNLSLQQYYHCLTFNDPRVGIEFLKNYQSPLLKANFKRELKESDLFGTNNHYPVDLNILNIKNIASVQEKSKEIAVLVVDYSMPGMNGLELCQQLKSLPMKKILLTGDATYEKAIEAFNRGLIDRFIKKDHNLSETLQIYIDELIYVYFHEKTAHLISHIEASKPCVLSDPNFIDFYNNWCRQNNIEEFYLINKQGSFLVKDKDDKHCCFVVMSELDKNEFSKLNDELYDSAGYLLNELSEGKMIPFFGIGTESWNIDVKEWKDYFYPANVILGREKYYWTVVDKMVI